MANDKTEPATPKRRKEARKKGQVAKSTELNGAVVLIAGLIAIMWVGPAVVSGSAGMMQTAWSLIADPGTVSSAAGLHGLESDVLHVIESTVAPIVGVVAGAAVAVNILQVGFRPSGAAIKPKFSRLNPATGAKNIFGKKIGVEFAKVLAKIALVGCAAAMALVPMITHVTAGIGTTPTGLGSLVHSDGVALIERVVVVYVLIALADLFWQRKQHTKQMRMSKHEVKEEGRQAELPPEVKSALRRRQIQAARVRMMAAVPTADVVVTNPTHYAVALRYDGTLPAPVVVAKGKNLVAVQIRRIAEENGVPIVPDPPLARSLHASVELDQMIPAELFAAVAQVLAYVYRMAGRRRLAA
jgi:flagellar biosynthetic protein FlhB